VAPPRPRGPWRRRVLVGPSLGLNGNASDTWAYEPATSSWLPQTFANAAAPAPRQMTGMAWDDAGGQGLLFGGRVARTGAANDLWALVPTTATVTPSPSPTPASVRKALDVGWVVDPSGKLLLTSQQVDEVATAGATDVRLAFNLGAGASWTPALLNTYGQAITMFENAGIGQDLALFVMLDNKNGTGEGLTTERLCGIL